MTGLLLFETLGKEKKSSDSSFPLNNKSQPISEVNIENKANDKVMKEDEINLNEDQVIGSSKNKIHHFIPPNCFRRH